MHRFFIPPEWIKGDEVVLSGSIVHQLRNVLRFRPGDPFIVLDNSGEEYQVELLGLSPDGARGKVIEKRLAQGEPTIQITLYQALLKSSKLEYVLQKGTELGVARFAPVLCERCVAPMKPGPEAVKFKRWQQIIREAAEQSGRGRLPVVVPPVSFSEACRQAQGVSLLPWEGEERLRIRDVFNRFPLPVPTPSRSRCVGTSRFQEGLGEGISIFIGPEGGFTAEEVEEARSHGILPVTLGKRILRAETAGLVAVTAVLCQMGEL